MNVWQKPLTRDELTTAKLGLHSAITVRIGWLDTPITLADCRRIRREIDQMSSLYVRLAVNSVDRIAAANKASLWNSQAHELLVMQIDRREH